jgi:hypothetical protein
VFDCCRPRLDVGAHAARAAGEQGPDDERPTSRRERESRRLRRQTKAANGGPETAADGQQRRCDQEENREPEDGSTDARATVRTSPSLPLI